MKPILMLLALMVCFSVGAQSNDLLPDQLLNTPVKNWQLNGLTILVVLQLLGRAYAALKNGGGLTGIWRGIVFGTNTPNKQ